MRQPSRPKKGPSANKDNDLRKTVLFNIFVPPTRNSSLAKSVRHFQPGACAQNMLNVPVGAIRNAAR